jgi:hypothetical protein
MKGSHALKTPGKKNPRNLCLAASATIGMAGVLRARLGITATLCKFFAGRSIGGYAVSSIKSLDFFRIGEPYFFMPGDACLGGSFLVELVMGR